MSLTSGHRQAMQTISHLIEASNRMTSIAADAVFETAPSGPESIRLSGSQSSFSGTRIEEISALPDAQPPPLPTTPRALSPKPIDWVVQAQMQYQTTKSTDKTDWLIDARWSLIPVLFVEHVTVYSTVFLASQIQQYPIGQLFWTIWNDSGAVFDHHIDVCGWIEIPGWDITFLPEDSRGTLNQLRN